MNNSFGIFSDDIESETDSIKLLGDQCKKLGDTVLFTDDISTNKFNDYAIFSSFYMKFFSGIIIFLAIEDYILYKDNIMGKAMLYLTEDMLKSNNIDLSLIDKTSVFSPSGGCQ